MAVPENIVSAYAAYLQGMEEAAGDKKSLSGLFGIGRDVTRERCQEDFISALTAAVEDFAASEPDPQETAEAVKYIFAQAHEHKKSREAYWMLLASHVLALPLIELLPAQTARDLRSYFEAEYPKRERRPAQNQVISALKAREK